MIAAFWTLYAIGMPLALIVGELAFAVQDRSERLNHIRKRSA